MLRGTILTKQQQKKKSKDDHYQYQGHKKIIRSRETITIMIGFSSQLQLSFGLTKLCLFLEPKNMSRIETLGVILALAASNAWEAHL